jgi:hypothetical protein
MFFQLTFVNNIIFILVLLVRRCYHLLLLIYKIDACRFRESSSNKNLDSGNIHSLEMEKHEAIDLDPLIRWILIQDTKVHLNTSSTDDAKQSTKKDDESNLCEILDVLDKDLNRLPEEHVF